MRQNWILVVVLALALFVRVYRLDALLGFYYDQGRDAKVIWDLWHKGKLFLIGPTTGIEGIFLGPFYYYLLAPAYLVGNGNPVWPAVWEALINVGAIWFLYRIGRTYFNMATGLVAAFLAALSFNLVQAQRWLANPAPLPLFALVVVWSLLAIVHARDSLRHWIGLGLAAGWGLQLEAASAVFFIPAVGLTLWLWRSRVRWRWRWVIAAGSAFGVTLLPQIVFDLRHEHLLLAGLRKFLVSERSFRPEIASRLRWYFEVFTNKFAPDLKVGNYIALVVVALTAMGARKLRKKAIVVLLIWWLTPAVGLLFYHGNYGYVWDYYFTGAYPALILLVAAVLTTGWRANLAGRLLVAAVLGLFIWHNVLLLKSTLTAGTDGPTHISLGSSLAAVDWVYQDSGGREFNVDVYVPPVIPHAYDYLFLWRGATKHHRQPNPQRTELLYTIHEVDPPHPKRLLAWLNRQAGIGQVEEEVRFGGVTVQRRHRI